MEKTKQAAPSELKYEETYAAQFCGFSLKNVIFGTPLIMVFFVLTPILLGLTRSEGSDKLSPLNVAEGFSNENIFLLGIILLTFIFILNAIYCEVLGLPFKKCKPIVQDKTKDQTVHSLLDYFLFKSFNFKRDVVTGCCAFIYALPSFLMETTSSLVLGCIIFYTLKDPSGHAVTLLLVLVLLTFYGIATKYLYSFSNFSRRNIYSKRMKQFIGRLFLSIGFLIALLLGVVHIDQLTYEQLQANTNAYLTLILAFAILFPFSEYLLFKKLKVE